MPSWNEPKSLAKISSLYICAGIINFTEIGVAEILSCDCAINYCKQCRPGTRITLLRSLLTEISLWWKSLPSTNLKLELIMKESLDQLTEIPPNLDENEAKTVTCMLLKLFLLDDVFLDRDYGDNVGMCLLPSYLEDILAGVIESFGKLPMTRLRVYGGIYPKILEEIIKNAPNLSSLTVSHINLSDDLLICIGDHCKNLRELHLMHSFIWQGISKEAFISSFFKGASEETLEKIKSQRKLASLSFPKLCKVSIAFTNFKMMQEIHSSLLCHYKNISTVAVDWRTCLFEDGYQFYAETVLYPLIKNEDILISYLKSLYLGSDFMASLNQDDIRMMLFSMPELEEIYIDCNLSKTKSRSAPAVGERLKQIGCESNSIKKLYVNISQSEEATSLIINPFLKLCGSNIISLTLEAKDRNETINLDTLSSILSKCPSLRQLKLLFWTRFLIEYPDVDDPFTSIDLPHMPNITELWLHEEGPWDCPPNSEIHKATGNWMKFLDCLLDLCDNLDILSVTVSRSLSIILDNLMSMATVLHLHIKDGCEWKISKRKIIDLVCRFPQLRDIFLEELEGNIFWEVKEHFANTNLEISWGNMGGWPRS